MSSKSPEELQLCSVCSKPCDLKCANCNQVHYCTKEHQKAHWTLHKKQCFPFRVETLEGKGRVLIATKAFSPGQIIYKEKALVNMPYVEEDHGMIGDTCVSCCKVMTEYRTCSKCGWPVCGKACEIDPQHAGNECSLFAERNVSPAESGSCVLLQVLRCLLLKQTQPEKYRKILELEANLEHSADNFRRAMMCTISIHLMKRSRILEFTEEEIIRVLCIVNTNILSQMTDVRLGQNLRRSAHLYEKGCLASHSCLPNSAAKIEKSGALSLLATSAVQIGDELSITYFMLRDGLVKRQKSAANYFFICRCPRCLSPTELGSYFSSIKCTACPTGYICPYMDERSGEITWTCEGCLAALPGADVEEIVTPLEQENQDLLGISRYNMDVVKRFDALLAKYENWLHPNHYLIFEVLYDFIEWMHNMVNMFQDTISNQEVLQLKKRIVQIGDRLLVVLDLIFPGPRLIRGRILFFMTTGLFEESAAMEALLNKMSKSKSEDQKQRKKPSESLQRFAELSRQAIGILSFEPKGTDDQAFVRTLAEQLELLGI